MSIAISLRNISKRYRLGTVNQRMLLDDLRVWRSRIFPGLKSAVVPAASATPEFWALKDISFDIKKGETVGLIGTNGAGKSTLLKLLARVTTPTTGEISIHGRVGTLLEVGSGFHPELTGRDNVFLNGAVLGMSLAEIESKYDEIVNFAELHDFMDTPVKRYSSGMRVRLAFSVAAIIEPEIMILDEVLAVGDLGFREKCLHRIEVLAAGGQTGLFVSHSPGHVSRLCSRVIWLEKGSVRMDGDTDMVCDEYRRAQIVKLAVHSSGHSAPLHLAGEQRNPAYKILDVETSDGLGRPTSRFRTGDACRIRVKYAKNYPWHEEITRVVLRLSILNEQGNRLLGLDSSLVRPQFIPFPDSATVSFEIPKLPLIAGTYSYSLTLSLNGELVDKAILDTSFIVEDGDFYGTGRMASASFTPLCVDFSCQLEEQKQSAYKILDVETRDSAGRSVASVRTGQSCCFAVKYTRNLSLGKEITKVTLRLSFIDEKARNVLGLQSSLVKPALIPFPDSGTVCFELPKIPLVTGTYSFLLSLLINGEQIDEVTPEKYLLVEKGDFYGTGRSTPPLISPISVNFNCFLEKAQGSPHGISGDGNPVLLPAEPNNPAYKIQGFEIHDVSGRPASRFRTGETCRMVVRCAKIFPLPSEITIAKMKLVILNNQGSCVLGLDSRMVRESLVPFPDEAAICFVLPKLPLTAGTYTFSLSLMMNGELTDSHVPETSLFVEKGDYYGTGFLTPASFTPCLVDFDCHIAEWENASSSPADPDKSRENHQVENA